MVALDGQLEVAAVGREFYDRITDAGYDYNFCGDNIAAGYATPSAVVNGWMDSPGHRRNILDSSFTQTAIGAWISKDGTVYFTEIFLK